jgi:L-lactate dehydrogenase complex protein LldG
MSARDAILGRIRAALAQEPESAGPPRYELWPPGTWQQPDNIFQYFQEELHRVQGEGHRVGSVEEAQQFLQTLHRELGEPITAIVEHPLCRSMAQGLPADKVQVVAPPAERAQLAAIPLAVAPAAYLLADTGTAVLMPRSHAERLLCYLPTVAVLVARADSLVAHLSDIWSRLTEGAHDATSCGELLLVTGPSRTADIEKKLVLGAHGPKRLIVLVV